MPEPRQLIVLGSSLTALAVVRNAAALGLRVILADTSRGIAFSSRYVDQPLRFEPDEVEVLLRTIQRLAADTPTALIADSDDWLAWIRLHRRALERSGMTVLHPADDVLATCLDKQRFSDWCQQRQLPVPLTFELDADGRLPVDPIYPVFVRPRTTRHAELSLIPKAAVAHNDVELDVVLERYRKWNVPAVVSQSLLGPGLRQLSYGFARRADGVQCGLVTEKLRPRPDQCATGSLVVTTQNREVQDLGRRAVEALGFVGIGEVELLHNDRTGRTYLIEVNARPWLQYGLAVASGRDLLRFQLRPDTYDATRESAAELRWISAANDLFNCFSRKAGLVRLGQLSRREYLASLRGRRTWAAWSLTDPRPAWEQGACAAIDLLRRLVRTKPDAAPKPEPAPAVEVEAAPLPAPLPAPVRSHPDLRAITTRVPALR